MVDKKTPAEIAAEKIGTTYQQTTGESMDLMFSANVSIINEALVEERKEKTELVTQLLEWVKKETGMSEGISRLAILIRVEEKVEELLKRFNNANQ